MGFKSVYRTLQELFPQVDARLLKAAAIEHSKDPNGAVEFILAEFIPHTMKQFDSSSSVNGSLGSSVECERQCFSVSDSSFKHESTAADEAANGSKEMKSSKHIDPAFLNETVQVPLNSSFYDAKNIDDQLTGNTRNKELRTSKTCEEIGHNAIKDVSSPDISVSPAFAETHSGDHNQESEKSSFEETSEMQKYQDFDLPTVAYSALSTSAILKDAVSNVSVNEKSINCEFDLDPVFGDPNAAVFIQSEKKQPRFDSDSLFGSNYVELASLSVKDHTLESLDCSIQSDVESAMSTSKLDIPEFSCTSDAALKEDMQVPDNANIEKFSSAHSAVTLDEQVCSADLLENVIEGSKRHKKKLFSDTESVLKLMREVQFQEEVAGQAKQDALRGGLEICARLDQLKSMLNRAREANDMHSGELYGERAILATEMRELQSRLLALSDLKEKSLSILDVIRQTLESRLTAAEMERIAAEKEKHEREDSAQKVLAEHELIVEKVVQESKILQQEAEENAKLREFLMDRGHVVDKLQGEISVICQDVKLLREKIENHVPLCQPLSSEQTSCILASSGSARKSLESDEQSFEHDRSSTSSVELVLPPSVEQETKNTQKELLDEGWDLFEDAVY